MPVSDFGPHLYAAESSLLADCQVRAGEERGRPPETPNKRFRSPFYETANSESGSQLAQRHIDVCPSGCSRQIPAEARNGRQRSRAPEPGTLAAAYRPSARILPPYEVSQSQDSRFQKRRSESERRNGKRGRPAGTAKPAPGRRSLGRRADGLATPPPRGHHNIAMNW